MNAKEIANQPYSVISDAIQYKLIKDYKENLLPVDEYRKISRGLNTVFEHLEMGSRQ